MSDLAKEINGMMGGLHIHACTSYLKRACGDCHAALTAFAPLAMTAGRGAQPRGVEV